MQFFYIFIKMPLTSYHFCLILWINKYQGRIKNAMQELLPKEKEIMEIIWQMKHPCLISDILKTDPALSRNTVAKVLVNLDRKGYIRVDSIKRTVTRTGRAYVPAVTKQEYEKQQALLESLLQNGSVASNMLSFFSSMLDADELDDDFLNEIETLIHNYKNAKE